MSNKIIPTVAKQKQIKFHEDLGTVFQTDEWLVYVSIRPIYNPSQQHRMGNTARTYLAQDACPPLDFLNN